VPALARLGNPVVANREPAVAAGSAASRRATTTALSIQHCLRQFSLGAVVDAGGNRRKPFPRIITEGGLACRVPGDPGSAVGIKVRPPTDRRSRSIFCFRHARLIIRGQHDLIDEHIRVEDSYDWFLKPKS
jgi:hypothetical protein